MTTVWVTKYALSEGIKETELKERETTEWAWVAWPSTTGGMGILMVRKVDVHHDKESALIRAEQMRIAKIESLRKQISKLEKKAFT